MVKLDENRDFVSDVTVGLGDDRNFVYDVTFGIHCYCKILVIPTSLSDALRDPIFLPALRLDKV